MTTCFCILAWTIPWIGEPGRLQSMGLQRVGHDWAYTHIEHTQIKCFWLAVNSSHFNLVKTILISLEDQGVFPHSSVDKEYACNAGDPSSIPGLGRYSGKGNGYPLQYSCLENLMDRGAWQATIRGVSRVVEQLNHYHSSRFLKNLVNQSYLDTPAESWESHRKKDLTFENKGREVSAYANMFQNCIKSLSSFKELSFSLFSIA